MSLFRLQNQLTVSHTIVQETEVTVVLQVAKASFIPEGMQVDPADQNSNAWDRAMAIYLRGMQPVRHALFEFYGH